MKYDKGWKAKKALKIFVCVLFVGIAIGYGVMSLWNWLIPDLFHGPVINFWQAIGLFILSKIFFGSKPGGGSHGGWKRHQWKEKLRDRMEHMTDEEKAKFRESFKNCRFGPWDRNRDFGQWDRDREPGFRREERYRHEEKGGAEEGFKEPPQRPGSDMA